jgi:hypothetical protein
MVIAFQQQSAEAACLDSARRLWREVRAEPRSDPLVSDPGLLFSVLGLRADAWQVQLLTSQAPRLLCLQCRQSGKSTGVAALALLTALGQPETEVLITSPSLRQSLEVNRKVGQFHKGLVLGEAGRWRRKAPPVTSWQEAEKQQARDAEETARFLEQYATNPDFRLARNAAMTKEFGNGSRIRSLPCSPDTIVGPSPDLLIIDEAARVPDALYTAMRPTLSRTKGRLVVCSTPFGKRGWFWEAWDRTSKQAELVTRYNGGESQEALARAYGYPLQVVTEILKAGGKPLWETIRVSCEDCPWLTPAFLAEERLEIGERWFEQEYRVQFRDAIDSAFGSTDIERAMKPAESSMLEELGIKW